MAIKKSELYSSLWASCDELRGGMDASQYKDYVLFMLFIKYISDKYADSDDFAPPVVIPPGAGFRDMVQLKGKSDIGDKINKQVIQQLIDANSRLSKSDFPDFNDPNKLGEAQAMVERLTNLISIFQKPELDFSQNRAEHDDILGDAYEYLMRNFAQDSGKSKGQFYTPAEVSRIIAKVIGIGPHNTVAATTCYDPTCGSGSLLLKVAAEAAAGAGKHITLEGQEKDVTTAGLARMNMILHNFPTANILNGNTLAAPKFKDGERLRTYDYVVANPPFSDKTWSTGLDAANDPYQRFAWGAPPAKQGDYAYLLHIIRSMKSTGKAACILPHGVLFRGNAEGVIRKQLVRSGILKGIIGLPANLFYGTGIPACILVLDKENAQARRGVLMIDASQGFIKEGNKNRLAEQDIHKIVDAFRRGAEIERYSRMVPYDEIAGPKNDYNLNLPRYIDSRAAEDRQDIGGHLLGGIPESDLQALDPWWSALPGVREMLLQSAGRRGYARLRLPAAEIKGAILQHPEFAAFQAAAAATFERWRADHSPLLKGFAQGGHPKQLIETIGEALLAAFKTAPLIDAYAVYQQLMDYWAAAMQDDCYLIAADGWTAKTVRLREEAKGGKNKGESRDKGWVCDLVPKPIIVARYFAVEQAALDTLAADLEGVEASLAELQEEYGGEEGPLVEVRTRKEAEEAFAAALVAAFAAQEPAAYAAYSPLVEAAERQAARLDAAADDPHLAGLKGKGGKLSAKAIKDRLAATRNADERAALQGYVEAEAAYKAASKAAGAQFETVEARYRARLAAAAAEAGAGELPAEDLLDLRAVARCLALLDAQAALKGRIKEADAALDKLAYAKYPQLSVDEIKTLVVDDKWLPAIAAAVAGEQERVSQALTGRLRQLAERYATPLPQLVAEVADLSARVEEHLKRMGAAL